MRVAALAVVPRVIRVLSRIHQAEAESPAPVATDQRIEELAPIVASPARVRKTPTKRLQIFNSVKRKSPPLWAWRAPSRSQAPPLHFGGSRSWAYLHRRSFPINASDPSGLEQAPPGYHYGPGGLEQIPGYDWDADTQRAYDAADFMLFLLFEGAMQGIFHMAGSKGASPNPAEEAVVEEGAAATTGNCPAARGGNDVHYDQLNGGKGQSGPSSFQNRYPNTSATHARRGQAGPDVTINKGTQHPSSYPGSNWPKNANHGDFKPATPSGLRQFRADLKSGKLPANTVMLPYDPQTGTVHIP